MKEWKNECVGHIAQIYRIEFTKMNDLHFRAYIEFESRGSVAVAPAVYLAIKMRFVRPLFVLIYSFKCMLSNFVIVSIMLHCFNM